MGKIHTGNIDDLSKRALKDNIYSVEAREPSILSFMGIILLTNRVYDSGIAGNR